jgi:hypothetical protein
LKIILINKIFSKTKKKSLFTNIVFNTSFF